MSKAARWLVATAMWLTLVVGPGGLLASGTPTALAQNQDDWIYDTYNGYGRLTHTVGGVATGHTLTGGQRDGVTSAVTANGGIWTWNGARWVNVFWLSTDGINSYLSMYSGNVLVFRAQLAFFSDGTASMIQIYPQNLSAIDPVMAFGITTANFTGYVGSQMWHGMFNAPNAGPIIP
jgi:hypothetical protein